MDEKQYLEDRVLDQEGWYDRKSQWNQRWYKRLSVVQIVAASLIPFLAGIGDAIPWSKWLIGFLGVVVAVASAVGSMYKFQENWIQYRTTSETLKHEKFLYLTKTAPYDGEDAFPLFVQNIEGMISRENTKWAQHITKEKKKGATPTGE